MADTRINFKSLQSLIEAESDLYRQYLQIIQNEREVLTKLKPDKILALSEERERLYIAMREAEKKRKDLLQQVSDGNKLKLSEFVQKNFGSQETKILLRQVENLKELVSRCQKTSHEFGQVVNFSLNMVTSLISILWSATQNIVRSYTPTGHIQETSYPISPRAFGLCREV